MQSNEFDTDVVVVGTGPMGGTTALALATYGVRVHVVSKWNWLANAPRAHIINQRAVEVLGRARGGESRAKQTPPIDRAPTLPSRPPPSSPRPKPTPSTCWRAPRPRPTPRTRWA